MPGGIFRLEVVTPESTLLSCEARSVVLRSSDGELTILDGHTPLVTDVVAGTVRVITDDDTVRLAVHGGYMQVDTGHGVNSEDAGGVAEDADASRPVDDSIETRVTLLAGVAELGDEIDVERAREAKEAATELVETLMVTAGAPGSSASAASSAGSVDSDPSGSGDEIEGSLELASRAVPLTPEELELAEARAALRRAEVRLEAAGAD